MQEFINGLSSLSKLEMIANIHGGLAMAALFLFGVSLISFLAIDKFAKAYKWLKISLILLLTNIVLLDSFGLFIYAPYRAKGGAKEQLLASPATAWLHEVAFEHKEFLAFAPLILLLCAAIIVISQSEKFRNNKRLKMIVLFSIITALIFVAVVATEAVLVAKTAPLK